MKLFFDRSNRLDRKVKIVCTAMVMVAGLWNMPTLASIAWCNDPYCEKNTNTAFNAQAPLSGTPVIHQATYPVPSGEYISRWFYVGSPESLIVSWNTPLNPAIVPGAEPTPVAEPTGTNASPILVNLSTHEIDANFFGALNLDITGLMAGQSVLLERFKTPTPVAAVNDPLTIPLSKARLQDGLVIESGEVANFNVLNDIDPTPGALSAQLNFLEPSVIQFPGYYVYRISSPSNAFTEAEVRLTVHEAPTTMVFTGRVTHAGNPVPYAMVAALDPVGTSFDFSYNDLVAGATADADGYYQLYVPYPAEFDVVATAPGYVGRYGNGASHVMNDNESLHVDLELVSGANTITGRVAEAGINGRSIPGLELVFLSLDVVNEIDFEWFTVAWTDENGAFSVDLPDGNWGVMVRVNTAADLGYVASRGLLLAFTSENFPFSQPIDLRMERGDSLIWGHVYSVDEDDGEGGPLGLEGIKMIAISADGSYASWGVTDADGEFRIAAKPGNWLVRPLSQSLWSSYYGGTDEHEVLIPASHASHNKNFLVRQSAADLFGLVTKEDESPVGRLTLLAINQDSALPEVERQVTHQEDGYYNFGLPSGTWRIVPDPRQAAEQQLLLVNPPMVVIDPLGVGVTKGGPGYPMFQLDLDVIEKETSLVVSVTDPDVVPVPRVVIEATAEIGGNDYLAYGYTDANGGAVIPVLPGTWNLHVAAPVLRVKGFRPIPDWQVVVPDLTPVVDAFEVTPFAYTEPSVTVAVVDGDGDIAVNADGEAGQRYWIESSDDLTTWFQQGRITAVNGTIALFQQNPGATESFKAYRLRIEQPELP